MINLIEIVGNNAIIVETGNINGVSIENFTSINNIINGAISTKTIINGQYSFPVGSNLAFSLTFSNVILY